MCFAVLKSSGPFGPHNPVLQLLQVLSDKAAGWACTSLALS